MSEVQRRQVLPEPGTALPPHRRRHHGRHDGPQAHLLPHTLRVRRQGEQLIIYTQDSKKQDCFLMYYKRSSFFFGIFTKVFDFLGGQLSLALCKPGKLLRSHLGICCHFR